MFLLTCSKIILNHQFFSISADDCGDEDPNLNTKNKCLPGGAKNSTPVDAVQSSSNGTGTGSGTEVEDGFLMDESDTNDGQAPETEIMIATEPEDESNLNEDDDETTGDEAGNAGVKRNAAEMCPDGSLEQKKIAKKISLAEPTKDKA